jgi:stalled ribosome rescue protein Dom34
MDHAEAHVLQFTSDEVEKAIIHSKGNHRQVHLRSGKPGSGKAPEDVDYFKNVIGSLEGAQQILLTGPANEKNEFRKYLQVHSKPVAARIVAVETSDHPSDGELLKQARKFFAATGSLQASR